jgi:hypothetical protein
VRGDRERQLPPIIRDVVLMCLGAGGIAYQQVTGQVSEVLLAIYVAMLGGPAIGGVWSLRRQHDDGTTDGSSRSPDPPPRPVSSSSSPSVSGGGDP